MLKLRAWTHSGGQTYLDLKEKESVRLNFNFSDLNNLAKPRGGYNKGFKLPPSTANIDYFQSFWDVNLEGSFNAKQKVVAILEDGGIPIMEGILQLTGVVIENGSYAEFEVRIFDDSVNLFNSIGDKKLSEYDWSDYDHILTNTTAGDAFTATGLVQSGITTGDLRYGIQDFGYGLRGDGSNGRYADIYNTTVPIHWRSFAPYIKLWTILKHVALAEGFKLDSTFFDGTVGDALFMLNYDPRHLPVIPTRDNYFKTRLQTNLALLNGVVEYPFFTITDNNVYWDEYGSIQYGDLGGVSFEAPVLPEAFGISYGIQYSFDVFGATTAGTIDVELIEVKDGTTTVLDSNTHAIVSGNQTFTDTFEPTYKGGGVLYLRVEADSLSFPATLLAEDSWWELTEHLDGAEADYDVGLNWGDIKAKDVFAAATANFNLLFVPVRGENTLTVEPYQDFLDAGSIVEYEIDRTKSYRISPLAEKGELTFSHKEADDIFNKLVKDQTDAVYGSKKILNNTNDFASGKKEVKSPAHTTPLNAIPTTSIMIPKMFNDKGEKSIGGIRFFWYGGQYTTNGTVRLRRYNGDTVDLTEVSFYGHYEKPIPDSTDLYDLNFGEVQPFHQIDTIPEKTAFNEYWAPFLRQVYDERASRLSCHLILKPHQITNLVYNEKIFIRSLNSYWRIESLDYNATQEESTKATLVKLDENTNFRFSDGKISGVSSGVISFEDHDGGAISSTRALCDYYGGEYRNGVCYLKQNREDARFTPVSTTSQPREKTITSTKSLFNGGSLDNNAIHDNVAGEIGGITEKTTPVSADLLIIEDSADSNNKKKVQIGNLPSSGSGGGTDISYFLGGM